MVDLIVIEEFRKYLVAQGIVRNWGDAANGLPQCILNPRDGAPEPGGMKGYQDATVTLTKTGQVPQAALEEFQEDSHIEVITRAYKAVDAELIQRRIRYQIDGVKMVVMGALLVEWVRVFSGDLPLGSDETSYTRMQTFMFRSRVWHLAGNPQP